MIYLVTFCCKTPPAELALEGLLARVRSHVVPQTRPLRKEFAAVVEIASKGLLVLEHLLNAIWFH